MLRAILNKSCRQHPIRHQLYGHLPPITKTIQVRRTRHAGHCWRSRDELIGDVLLWTPTYGRVKAGRPARTYIQQLCEDTGCSPEDLPEAMNDREKWRERVRDIRATSTTWWWWWWLDRNTSNYMTGLVWFYGTSTTVGWGGYPTAKKQSVYYTAPADWETIWLWNLFVLDSRRRCPWCNGYRCRKWTWRHETRLIAFHIALIPLGKVWIQLLSLQLWVNSKADWFL